MADVMADVMTEEVVLVMCSLTLSQKNRVDDEVKNVRREQATQNHKVRLTLNNLRHLTQMTNYRLYLQNLTQIQSSYQA